MATRCLNDISSTAHRILLINTHAIDVRLPWARRHQPLGLLQLGAALKRHEYDVRFIDCLSWDARERVRRRKVGEIEVEGYKINLWRFGGLWGHLDNYIWKLKAEGWNPDQIYVSCSQTTWWQGARDLIKRIKNKWYPNAQVVLGGVYPTAEPGHAALHTKADLIVAGPIPEARDEIPDLTLYHPEHRPLFAGIYLYQSQSLIDAKTEQVVVPRAPGEIAQEVADKAALGVTEFAFFDEEIRSDQRQHFLNVLQAIAARELDVRFVTIGNISPSLIDGEIAQCMRKARYQQGYLKCEVTRQSDGVVYNTPDEIYRACVDALHREADFKPRTDQVTAMLLVGTPHEDIEIITERLIRLASIVGSVNLIQYQYTSDVTGDLGLTHLNCKLYPLTRATGTPFEYYVELTRLAALLNSKYRSKTFDFLGDSIIARAVQESIRTYGWHPFTSLDSQYLRPS